MLNTGRRYYGYSHMDPYKVEKYLQMLRFYRNFCLPMTSGRFKGKTPAWCLAWQKVR